MNGTTQTHGPRQRLTTVGSSTLSPRPVFIHHLRAAAVLWASEVAKPAIQCRTRRCGRSGRCVVTLRDLSPSLPASSSAPSLRDGDSLLRIRLTLFQRWVVCCFVRPCVAELVRRAGTRRHARANTAHARRCVQRQRRRADRSRKRKHRRPVSYVEETGFAF